jgi:hypothetical protein
MSGSVEQLPQPVHHNSSRTVENTFPRPASRWDVLTLHRPGHRPDRFTHFRHTWHMYRRRRKGEPKKYPEVMMVDHPVPAQVRKLDGIYPVRSVLATAAATVAFFPFYHPTIGVGTERPAVPAQVKIVDIQGQPELVKDKPVQLTVLFKTGQTRAADEAGAAMQFVQQIEDREAVGQIVISGDVRASSSPDFRQDGERTLTQSNLANAKNLSLAGERGRGLQADITAAARNEHVSLPEIPVSSEVRGLSKKQIAEVNISLAKHGFGTLADSFATLFNTYDNDPELLEPEVRVVMDSVIGGTRRATATAEIGHIVVPEIPQAITIPGPPGTPKHEIPLFIPIPLVWPKTHKEKGTKNIPRPELIGADLPNPKWLWFYPEAKKPDDTLVENPVLYTRLMQVFMRDGRISKVLTQRYLDDTDQQQTIRSLFIDHEPTEGAVAYVKEFMTILSYALGGKVGDYLDIVGVFPEETAGTTAKKAGLGLDHQKKRTVDGHAIPLARYAEILAPSHPTAEDFANIDGFVGTIVHELAGHYGDLNGKEIKITPISERKGTYVSSNPWAEAAASIAARYPNPGNMSSKKLQFEIVVDEAGGEATYLVPGIDPRLGKAKTVRLMNAAPTSYATKHPLELFAEAARQVVSGKVFSFEDIGIQITPEDGYSQGYAVSHELQELVAGRLGATVDGIGLAWPEESVRKRASTSFDETTMEGDEVIRNAAVRARKKSQPRKRKMVKIKVSSSGSELEEMAA